MGQIVPFLVYLTHNHYLEGLIRYASSPISIDQTQETVRILLISPRGPLYRHRTGIWKKSLRYAPLTLTTLAALIPAELNAEVTLVDEGIEAVDLEAEADLVGISAITGTAPRSYDIADHLRILRRARCLGPPPPTAHRRCRDRNPADEG